MKLGMDTPWDPAGDLGVDKVCTFPLRLCVKRVMGQRGKLFFFFAFLCVSEQFESVETFTFFPKIIAMSAKRERDASAKRESRNAHEQREQDASTKLEGAKRPSSPAGLAGRPAKRACRLVVK